MDRKSNPQKYVHESKLNAVEYCCGKIIGMTVLKKWRSEKNARLMLK